MNYETGLIVLVTAIVIKFLFKVRNLYKTIKETAKDNEISKENTSIMIWGRRNFKIKNYKKKETEKIKKFVRVLSDELDSNLIFRRKNQVISIKEITKVTRKGLFEQSIEDGIYRIYKKSNIENGAVVVGTTGTGKSVLCKVLLEDIPAGQKYLVSPKKDEDFIEGQAVDEISEAYVLELIERANKGEFKNKPMWILLDELISINSVWKKTTIEKINASLTISRSQGLRWLLLTQTLNKSSVGINIGFMATKIINIPDVKNYASTIGQEIQTNTNLLSKGEFVLLDNTGKEKILINNI